MIRRVTYEIGMAEVAEKFHLKGEPETIEVDDVSHSLLITTREEDVPAILRRIRKPATPLQFPAGSFVKTELEPPAPEPPEEPETIPEIPPDLDEESRKAIEAMTSIQRKVVLSPVPGRGKGKKG